jgi:hypothetical protein
MRLGTILGGKAWGLLNDAARVKRRDAEQRRKEDYDRRQRRAVLNAAGFVPLKTHSAPVRPASWGSE